MSNPTPLASLIVAALLVVLGRIRTSNGYFTDAGADVEEGDLVLPDGTAAQTLQAIRVIEEKSTITDSNASQFLDVATYVCSGFVSATADQARELARQLRDDITVALIRARATDFVGPGRSCADSYQVKGDREIHAGDRVVQVLVRVEITAKQSVSAT